MLKALIASGVAVSAAVLGSPAIAGPYLNAESNSGWTGTQYNGAVTDFHVGYEGELGDAASWYVQGGGSFIAPSSGAASDTVPSGKAGISIAATESLNMYGEVSFLGSGDDDIDRSYGGKLGVKYSF